MKENKLKVSFFVQAKRTDKKGLVPVIGRISVGRTHWKSHATLTLLATQDCPLWLQYD